MADLRATLGRDSALIAMVHLQALPGTPGSDLDPADIVRRAVDEARTLQRLGFDALLVENMHDAPYMLRTVGPEIIATMTAATAAVVAAVDLPVGVQVLAGANTAALAVAHATGAAFIRAEGFAFAAVADEGIMDVADAGPLLRERSRIGGESIAVAADVLKKHASHAICGDLSVREHVRGAEFMGADAIIVTGAHTGDSVDQALLNEARGATDLPLLIGSGATPENLAQFLCLADAAIVGSSLKQEGHWANALDEGRCSRVVGARDVATSGQSRQAR